MYVRDLGSVNRFLQCLNVYMYKRARVTRRVQSMSLLEWCRWLQDTPIGAGIRESAFTTRFSRGAT